MQLITRATTPKEARDEISAMLKFKADSALSCAEKTKDKTEKKIYNAVWQELQSTADFIDAITDGAK